MKKYTIIYSDAAKKQLETLDNSIRIKIFAYLHKRITQNPKYFGKALVGSLRNFWRYRVGDYRIICEIKDSELIVFIIKIGHRSKVYEWRTK